MSAHQKVPDRDELRRLLIAGHTRAQIARQFDVTHQAIQAAVKRYGLAEFVTAKADYSAYLPWGHLGGWGDHYIPLMLRAYAYERMNGMPHPRHASRVERFCDYLRTLDVVVTWHGPEVGFSLDPRQDGDWTLIRPRDADGNPLLGTDDAPLREPDVRVPEHAAEENGSKPLADELEEAAEALIRLAARLRTAH